MHHQNWEDKVLAAELTFMKAKLAYEQAFLEEVRLVWQCQQFSRLPMCDKRQTLVLEFFENRLYKDLQDEELPLEVIDYYMAHWHGAMVFRIQTEVFGISPDEISIKESDL